MAQDRRTCASDILRRQNPQTCCDSLLELLVTRGHERYDERVTQLDHAQQTATLAEAAGAPDELIVAGLLHDIGHLLLGEDLEGGNVGDDLEHERIGARFLARLFGPGVARPVALHVTAKRYLVMIDREYAGWLSNASIQSLKVQGGAMTRSDATHFSQLPYADEAVRLRRWDDLAKVAGTDTADVSHWQAPILRLLRG